MTHRIWGSNLPVSISPALLTVYIKIWDPPVGIAMDATARDVTLSLDTGTFAAIAALEGGKHKNNVQKNNSNDSSQNAELKT